MLARMGFKRAKNLVAITAMYRENGFPFEEVAKGELPDNPFWCFYTPWLHR